MTILGIIAEYNPFHNGHAKHLRAAQEAVHPDFTYVALSGCFTQRGELALLSPHDRAGCALDAGADAVFLLPEIWTVRDAEHYALGGVSLLESMGATHLAFGAEEGRKELLEETAELLERREEEIREALRQGLAEGMGYPRALAGAVGSLDPKYSAVLEKPNNILAVSYLRAMRRLGSGMTAVPVPRAGAYRTEEILPEEPSASALRGGLRRGDYVHAWPAMPAWSAERIRKALLDGRVPREERLDAILIHRLREMGRGGIRSLPDTAEGLEDRILEAARRVSSRQELLDAACTRRYPRARISRICACALLGITREDAEEAPLPAGGMLLGLRNRKDMTGLWRETGKNPGAELPGKADLQAWRIWAECAGLEDHLPYSEKVVRKG